MPLTTTYRDGLCSDTALFDPKRTGFYSARIVPGFYLERITPQTGSGLVI